MYINNMNKFRKEKGMTLTELSYKTGISIGYLSHLENGTRKNPSIEIMDKLARALERSIQELFFTE